MGRIPVHDSQLKGTRHRKPRRLEKEIDSLCGELEELTIRNSQLLARENILLDSCRVLSVVTSIVASIGDAANACLGAGAASLEQDIARLVGGSLAPAGRAVVQQVPGGTERFLLNSIKGPYMLDPSFRSLLQGQPLSLLECSLLAFGTDPVLRHNLAESMQGNNEQQRIYYESHVEECRALLQALDEAEAEPAKAQAAVALACWMLFGLSLTVGLYITEQSLFQFQGLFTGDSSDPLGQHSSTARVEQLTDRLQLSREQLDRIMVGVQLFSDLQKPLDKHEANLLTSIHQLLQLPGGQPQQAVIESLSVLDVFRTSPASATTAFTWVGPEALKQDGRVEVAEPAAAEVAGAGGRGGEPGGCTRSRICRPGGDVCAQFMLSATHIQDHEELKPLLDQLQKVQCKLLWLDAIAGFYVGGCLTWEQHARYLVESWPNPGTMIPFAKNLAMRSSLQWIKLLEGQYSNEVLP